MRSLAAAALCLAAAAGCRYDSTTLGGAYATGTITTSRKAGLLVGNPVTVAINVFLSDEAHTPLAGYAVRVQTDAQVHDVPGPTSQYGYTSVNVSPKAVGKFTVHAFIQPKDLPEIEITPALELTAVATAAETVVFELPPKTVDAGVVVGLAAGDLDGDSVPDLVAVQSTIAAGALVFHGGWGVLSNAPLQHALEGQPSHLAIGRFAGGTRDAVAVAHATPSSDKTVLEVFAYDTGSGTLVAKGNRELQDVPKALAAADLGGTGTAFAVVAEPLRSAGAIELVSFATASPQATSFSLPGPVALAVGRVDADTIDDVAIVDSEHPRIIVMYGAPGTALGRNTPVAVRVAPVALAIADVTGDGKADIIAVAPANPSAVTPIPNLLAVYAQDATVPPSGVPSFTLAQTVALDGAPCALATGDLNRDDPDDVVVLYQAADSGSARMLVLVQTSGVLQAATPQPIADKPLAAVVGDLDDDGHEDVAVASYGQPLRVFLGR